VVLLEGVDNACDMVDRVAHLSEAGAEGVVFLASGTLSPLQGSTEEVLQWSRKAAMAIGGTNDVESGGESRAGAPVTQEATAAGPATTITIGHDDGTRLVNYMSLLGEQTETEQVPVMADIFTGSDAVLAHQLLGRNMHGGINMPTKAALAMQDPPDLIAFDSVVERLILPRFSCFPASSIAVGDSWSSIVEDYNGKQMHQTFSTYSLASAEEDNYRIEVDVRVSPVGDLGAADLQTIHTHGHYVLKQVSGEMTAGTTMTHLTVQTRGTTGDTYERVIEDMRIRLGKSLDLMPP